MLVEDLVIDSRLVVMAFKIADGAELAEVVVTRRVLAEHELVVVAITEEPGVVVESAGRRKVQLAADDGLDAALLGRLVKLDGAKEVAVVRQL